MKSSARKVFGESFSDLENKLSAFNKEEKRAWLNDNIETIKNFALKYFYDNYHSYQGGRKPEAINYSKPSENADACKLIVDIILDEKAGEEREDKFLFFHYLLDVLGLNDSKLKEIIAWEIENCASEDYELKGKDNYINCIIKKVNSFSVQEANAIIMSLLIRKFPLTFISSTIEKMHLTDNSKINLSHLYDFLIPVVEDYCIIVRSKLTDDSQETLDNLEQKFDQLTIFFDKMAALKKAGLVDGLIPIKPLAGLRELMPELAKKIDPILAEFFSSFTKELSEVNNQLGEMVKKEKQLWFSLNAEKIKYFLRNFSMIASPQGSIGIEESDFYLTLSIFMKNVISIVLNGNLEEEKLDKIIIVENCVQVMMNLALGLNSFSVIIEKAVKSEKAVKNCRLNSSEIFVKNNPGQQEGNNQLDEFFNFFFYFSNKEIKLVMPILFQEKDSLLALKRTIDKQILHQKDAPKKKSAIKKLNFLLRNTVNGIFLKATPGAGIYSYSIQEIEATTEQLKQFFDFLISLKKKGVKLDYLPLLKNAMFYWKNYPSKEKNEILLKLAFASSDGETHFDFLKSMYNYCEKLSFQKDGLSTFSAQIEKMTQENDASGNKKILETINKIVIIFSGSNYSVINRKEPAIVSDLKKDASLKKTVNDLNCSDEVKERIKNFLFKVESVLKPLIDEINKLPSEKIKDIDVAAIKLLESLRKKMGFQISATHSWRGNGLRRITVSDFSNKAITKFGSFFVNEENEVFNDLKILIEMLEKFKKGRGGPINTIALSKTEISLFGLIPPTGMIDAKNDKGGKRGRRETKSNDDGSAYEFIYGNSGL